MNNALPFYNRIRRLSGQPIELCLQCHKCTSGCPVAGEMTHGPDRILRMVQLGDEEALLGGKDIWACVACGTCGARCPNGIDTSRVIDALKQTAWRDRVKVAEPATLRFHRLFLQINRHLGRMHEPVLMGLFILLTGKISTDPATALKLLAKGKVPVFPQRVKSRGDLRRIFRRCGAKDSGTRDREEKG